MMDLQKLRFVETLGAEMCGGVCAGNIVMLTKDQNLNAVCTEGHPSTHSFSGKISYNISLRHNLCCSDRRI